MASSGIRGFYRQQKKAAGVGSKKGSAKPAVRSNPTTLIPISSLNPQAAAAAAEEEAEEARLRQFDLDMRYGPCIGMTRMERWDRASSMGLNPPADVEAILLRLGDRAGPSECLWEGRV